MSKTLVNACLLAGSIIIALLLSEAMCRTILNPADYLLAEVVDDPILDHRVSEDTPGFDEWGFRNEKVPEQADIVTIGDSHTYSNNASMKNSWPNVLGRLTNTSVYNMSIGSYSPVQYYHLFKTKALKLNPERIVIGFYMGNDQMDSYKMSYYNKHWHHLRDSTLAQTLDRSGSDIIDRYIHQDTTDTGDQLFLNDLRGWLSRHSFVYRLTVHGPILGTIKRKIKSLITAYNNNYTRLTIEDENIDEGFRPVHRANKVDMSNIRIKEGLRINLMLLKKMNELSKKNGTKFTVMMIPSKEYVYGKYLSSDPKVNNYKDIKRLLMNEQKMVNTTKAFFDVNEISYTNPVSLLQEEIGKNNIYPESYDDHPTPYGYTLYAKSMYKKLTDLITESSE